MEKTPKNPKKQKTQKNKTKKKTSGLGLKKPGFFPTLPPGGGQGPRHRHYRPPRQVVLPSLHLPQLFQVLGTSSAQGEGDVYICRAVLRGLHIFAYPSRDFLKVDENKYSSEA